MLDERRKEIIRRYGMHERDTSSPPVMACFLVLKLERIVKEVEEFPEREDLKRKRNKVYRRLVRVLEKVKSEYPEKYSAIVQEFRLERFREKVREEIYKSLSGEGKQIIAKYGKHYADTGSPQVQVGFLTLRLKRLIEYLKQNPHDEKARKALRRVLKERRTVLNKLKLEGYEKYEELAGELSEQEERAIQEEANTSIIVEEFGEHENDTGSLSTQIGYVARKTQRLMAHIKNHPNEVKAKEALQKRLERLTGMLEQLKTQKPERHALIVGKIKEIFPKVSEALKI